MVRSIHQRSDRERLDVKMTPMIDVIFLLLIFFVCTASFQPAEHILPTRLSLPGAQQSQKPPDPELVDLERIIVKVLWRGGRPAWQINQRDYASLSGVRGVLEAARQVKPDLPVILDVEPAVPMEHVIDVYDLSRQVGLERIQFAASVGA
jgi:biopolymer transport protein ExbD